MITYRHLKILRDYSPMHLYGVLYEGLELNSDVYDDAHTALSFAINSTPHAFVKKYHAVVGYNKTQKRASRFEGNANGKISIDGELHKDIMQIQSKFTNSNPLNNFKNGAILNHDVTFIQSGHDCVANVDVFNMSKQSILITKITKNAGTPFENELIKRGYYAECAFICDAVQAVYGFVPICYIMAVERTKPYAYGVFKISPDLIEIGRKENLEHLDALNGYQEKGYPSYFGGHAKVVEAPQWLYR
jgi:hypothetical protein